MSATAFDPQLCSLCQSGASAVSSSAACCSLNQSFLSINQKCRVLVVDQRRSPAGCCQLTSCAEAEASNLRFPVRYSTFLPRASLLRVHYLWRSGCQCRTGANTMRTPAPGAPLPKPGKHQPLPKKRVRDVVYSRFKRKYGSVPATVETIVEGFLASHEVVTTSMLPALHSRLSEANTRTRNAVKRHSRPATAASGGARSVSSGTRGLVRPSTSRQWYRRVPTVGAPDKQKRAPTPLAVPQDGALRAAPPASAKRRAWASRPSPRESRAKEPTPAGASNDTNGVAQTVQRQQHQQQSLRVEQSEQRAVSRESSYEEFEETYQQVSQVREEARESVRAGLDKQVPLLLPCRLPRGECCAQSTAMHRSLVVLYRFACTKQQRPRQDKKPAWSARP